MLLSDKFTRISVTKFKGWKTGPDLSSEQSF